jgi:uncharacterized protein YjbI with pentapeptide repeats
MCSYYVDGCNLQKVAGFDECILHCSKEKMSNNYHLHFKELNNFYIQLCEYIIEQIFNTTEETSYFDKNIVRSILKNERLNDNIIAMRPEIIQSLKEQIVVLSHIAFPKRDSRDFFDYIPMLQNLGKIHFNYCEFYLGYIKLPSIECFFQDCEFYVHWSIYDYYPLENISNVIYQQCKFYDHVSASGNESLNSRLILNHQQFDNCNFEKELAFEYIDAKEAIFADSYELRSNIKKLKLYHSNFEKRFVFNDYIIESAYFENSVFDEKFEFKNNVVGTFEIDDCNFKKIADFFETTFEKFKIHKSIFDNFTGFELCKFGKETDPKNRDYIALLEYVTFSNFVNFRNTHFYSGLDIDNINLKDSPNFLNTEIGFSNTTRETFRIVKNSFDKIGNHIDANHFFALEMKKYKEELSKQDDKNAEKLVFWFNEKISDFGQNYVRPIGIFIALSLLFYMLTVGYEKEWLYVFNEPVNHGMELIATFFNGLAKSLLPFESKLLKTGMEFISLLFYIAFSVLTWQIIVAVKRHTKRE